MCLTSNIGTAASVITVASLNHQNKRSVTSLTWVFSKKNQGEFRLKYNYGLLIAQSFSAKAKMGQLKFCYIFWKEKKWTEIN